MRYTLLLLVALLVGSAASAQGPQDGVPYEFTGVVKLDSNLTAESIFIQARKWFTDAFYSGKAVVELNDKEAGQITGRGNFVYALSFFGGLNQSPGCIWFTVNIEVKPGKYRYRIYNFNHEVFSKSYNNFGLITTARSSPPQSWEQMGGEIADKQWHKMQAAVQEKGKLIQSDLISYMAQTPPAKDEW